MNWSEETMAALRAWLGGAHWFGHHPADDDRFYGFIAAVWDEVGGLWNEKEAKEIIAAEARAINPNQEPLIPDTVKRAHDEGTLILEFLAVMKQNGRTFSAGGSGGAGRVF